MFFEKLYTSVTKNKVHTTPKISDNNITVMLGKITITINLGIEVGSTRKKLVNIAVSSNIYTDETF